MTAGDGARVDVFTAWGHGWFVQQVRTDADGLELQRKTLGEFATRDEAYALAREYGWTPRP